MILMDLASVEEVPLIHLLRSAKNKKSLRKDLGLTKKMHLRLCPTQAIRHSSQEIISSVILKRMKHSGWNTMVAKTFQLAFSKNSL
jgi:hypothetical protein